MRTQGCDGDNLGLLSAQAGLSAWLCRLLVDTGDNEIPALFWEASQTSVASPAAPGIFFPPSLPPLVSLLRDLYPVSLGLAASLSWWLETSGLALSPSWEFPAWMPQVC